MNEELKKRQEEFDREIETLQLIVEGYQNQGGNPNVQTATFGNAPNNYKNSMNNFNNLSRGESPSADDDKEIQQISPHLALRKSPERKYSPRGNSPMGNSFDMENQMNKSQPMYNYQPLKNSGNNFGNTDNMLDTFKGNSNQYNSEPINSNNQNEKFS